MVVVVVFIGKEVKGGEVRDLSRWMTIVLEGDGVVVFHV